MKSLLHFPYIWNPGNIIQYADNSRPDYIYKPWHLVYITPRFDYAVLYIGSGEVFSHTRIPKCITDGTITLIGYKEVCPSLYPKAEQYCEDHLMSINP